MKTADGTHLPNGSKVGDNDPTNRRTVSGGADAENGSKANTKGLADRGYKPEVGERSLTREELKKIDSDIRAASSVVDTTGHGNARHGSSTTFEQQKSRLDTGIAPDGAKAPTTRATKFKSDHIQLEVLNKALKRFDQIKTDIPKFKNGKPNTYAVEVDLKDKGVGSGYVKDKRTDNITATGNDTKARVVFKFNAENNQWELLTQYSVKSKS